MTKHHTPRTRNRTSKPSKACPTYFLPGILLFGSSRALAFYQGSFFSPWALSGRVRCFSSDAKGQESPLGPVSTPDRNLLQCSGVFGGRRWFLQLGERRHYGVTWATCNGTR